MDQRSSNDDVLAEVVAQVRRLTDRVAEVEAENARLRAAAPTWSPAIDQEPSAVPTGEAVAQAPAADSGAPEALDGSGRGVIGRRALVAGAAGLAAAAVTASSATPAAAANGGPLLMGSANNATAATGLVVNGAPPFGIAVSDNGDLPVLPAAGAIVGYGVKSNFGGGGAFGAGVVGVASADANGVVGVANRAAGGRFSANFGTGVEAISWGYGLSANGGDTGVRATGGLAALRLDPSPDWTSTDGKAGQVAVTGTDENVAYSLWWCERSGTEFGLNLARWRKIIGPDTAGAFRLLPVPARVYDSRPGTLPAQGPKTPIPTGNQARTIDLKVNSSGVPAGATGVMLTLLLVNAATGGGNLTVWAADKAKPQANTMVWGGNAGRFTASATTSVDAQAQVKVNASLSTDIVIDVVGYYQ